MRKTVPATLETLSTTVREEFTTLNILVQALNRQLRDYMLTALREIRHLNEQLEIRPVYGRAPHTKRGTRKHGGR